MQACRAKSTFGGVVSRFDISLEIWLAAFESTRLPNLLWKSAPAGFTLSRDVTFMRFRYRRILAAEHATRDTRLFFSRVGAPPRCVQLTKVTCCTRGVAQSIAHDRAVRVRGRKRHDGVAFQIRSMNARDTRARMHAVVNYTCRPIVLE